MIGALPRIAPFSVPPSSAGFPPKFTVLVPCAMNACWTSPHASPAPALPELVAALEVGELERDVGASGEVWCQREKTAEPCPEKKNGVVQVMVSVERAVAGDA